MSHYVKIKTKIMDQQALIRALERMGLKGMIEQHLTAVKLNGYDTSLHMAHVLVRQQNLHSISNYNDLGFERQADGTYVAHMADVADDWKKKLLGYYGIEKAKMILEEKGMSYYECEDEQHKPRLRIPVEL